MHKQGQGIIPCCYVPRERRRRASKDEVEHRVFCRTVVEREREREREKKAANGSEEKERNILEGNEMQMYSLHGKVNGRKCAEGQPPSATGDYIYTHETPEFKVEVNYLAKDLRLGRHLPSMTLAPRGPPPVSFFALILDR